MAPMVGVSADARQLQDLARALGRASNGRELRRELSERLRNALKPARDAAKAQILSMPSKGTRKGGQPLRRAVAREVKIEARLTGRVTGARIKVTDLGMPRGFKNAPKRLNSKRGWRHPVFGNREVWRTQRGKPEWFDRPVRQQRERYRAAMQAAMESTARRLAQRAS